MRSGKFAVFTGIIILMIFVDTTLFRNLNFAGAKPDFPMVLLVFMAHALGSRKAVTVGFIAGLTVDILTLAPLGFFALIYAVVGYLYGKTKGNVFLDPLFFPLVLLLVASFIKIVLSAVLTSIFMPEKADSVFASYVFIESGMNMIVAPFFLGLLKVTGLLKNHDREGF